MATRGAPKGNTNAKKGAGNKINLYLSRDDMKLLRFVQEKYGQDTSDIACFELARSAAKTGINSLLRPEYYEIATKRVTKGEK